MADERVTTNTETQSTPTAPATNETTSSSPTVEELLAQLATAKADAERFKNANDKLSKSEAEMKRQLRAKLTAEEQEAEAQKEAQRLAEEERESLRSELNHIKALNAYKSMNDDKAVEKLINAISDADHNAIATIIENECKKAVAEAEQKWMKERPRVQHGNYSSMTKEQVMAITDRDERLKAIAMNKELFK